MPINILLVDDHKIIREGLRLLLEKEEDIRVVAEADSGNQAIEIARKFKPDVIILDIAMPNGNGIEAATKIHAEMRDIKIIALTMHSNKSYLTGMLKAGTVGYLLKHCAAEELVDAVREVMNGKAYISSDVAPLLLEDYSGEMQRANASTKDRELGPKEVEVLKLITEGLDLSEIAERLQCSLKTVERNRNQIMAKLKLFSIAELTKYAIKNGIVNL